MPIIDKIKISEFDLPSVICFCPDMQRNYNNEKIRIFHKKLLSLKFCFCLDMHDFRKLPINKECFFFKKSFNIFLSSDIIFAWKLKHFKSKKITVASASPSKMFFRCGYARHQIATAQYKNIILTFSVGKFL